METDAAVGVVGPVVAAVGRAAVPGVVAPGAAAQQPVIFITHIILPIQFLWKSHSAQCPVSTT